MSHVADHVRCTLQLQVVAQQPIPRYRWHFSTSQRPFVVVFGFSIALPSLRGSTVLPLHDSKGFSVPFFGLQNASHICKRPFLSSATSISTHNLTAAQITPIQPAPRVCGIYCQPFCPFSALSLPSGWISRTPSASLSDTIGYFLFGNARDTFVLKGVLSETENIGKCEMTLQKSCAISGIMGSPSNAEGDIKLRSLFLSVLVE